MNAIANVITRAIVNRIDPDGAIAQVMGLGGHTTPEVEVFQPQGVHFKLASGAEGILAAPTGDAGNAVFIAANDRTALPDDALLTGEGGLHLEGDWKVFLATDGTLHLSQKDPTDFVALASKVDAALALLQAAFDSHTHITTATVGATPTPGVNAPTAAPVGPLAPVGSLLVKAQ